MSSRDPEVTRIFPAAVYCLCQAQPPAYASARRKITARLHRLDARTGLPADVPDSRLRFLAEPTGAAKPLFHVLPVGWNLSGAAVSVSGRNLVRAGHGKTAAEESAGSADRPHHDLPGRGDFRVRPALSPARIPGGVGMGSQKRPAARRYSQHHRPFHDADGNCLLAGSGCEARSGNALGAGTHCRRDGVAHFPADPAAVDNLASALASLAAGIVRQWRTQSRNSAGVFVPGFSLVGFRLRGSGGGIYPARLMGPGAGTTSLFLSGLSGQCADRIRPLAGVATAPALYRRGLLAYQSELFSDPGGNAAGDSDRELCLVPLGRSPMGLQSGHPSRTGVATGVLGAHRVRLRPRVDFAKACAGNRRRLRGTIGDFSCDAGAGLRSDEDKRARRGNAAVVISRSGADLNTR